MRCFNNQCERLDGIYVSDKWLDYMRFENFFHSEILEF